MSEGPVMLKTREKAYPLQPRAFHNQGQTQPCCLHHLGLPTHLPLSNIVCSCQANLPRIILIARYDIMMLNFKISCCMYASFVHKELKGSYHLPPEWDRTHIRGPKVLEGFHCIRLIYNNNCSLHGNENVIILFSHRLTFPTVFIVYMTMTLFVIGKSS